MNIQPGRISPSDADDGLLHALRAAALAAITTLDRESASDSNPHTSQLTPYDLARLFCLSVGDRNNVAGSLDDVALVVRRTSGPSVRRAARARWIAHELTRLGQAEQAADFAALADDPRPGTP